MPQPTLFEGFTITSMAITVELPVNRPGGRIAVRFEDENGRAAGGRTVQWQKPRDLSDLGMVLRDLGSAFMFAPQLEMVDELRQAFLRWCPQLTQDEMIG